MIQSCAFYNQYDTYLNNILCLYLQDTEEEEDDGDDDDDDSSADSMGISLDLGLLWTGDSMTDKVMTIWLKRKENLCHDYSLVGFLLSPNPTIMEATEKYNADHKAAVARLIE